MCDNIYEEFGPFEESDQPVLLSAIHARMEKWMELRNRVRNLHGVVNEHMDPHGRSLEINFRAGGLEVSIFEDVNEMSYPVSDQTMSDLLLLLDIAERRKLQGRVKRNPIP